MKLQDFVERASMAQGRTFSGQQQLVLIGVLSKYEFSLFHRIADEYLSLDQPPKNVEAYFRKRGHEINSVKADNDYCKSLVGDRPTAKEQSLYISTMWLATSKYAGDEYLKWILQFNEIFVTLTGTRLLETMQQTHDIVSRMPTLNKRLPQIDNSESPFDAVADPMEHRRKDLYGDDPVGW
jgi:hypothetical protein